jgi:hypothetical protein
MMVLQARLKPLSKSPAQREALAERDPAAGLAHPDAVVYRIICGFGGFCPGLLGEAHPGRSRRMTRARAIAVSNLAGVPAPRPEDWFVYHPEGLQRQEDGSYRVMTATRRDAQGRKIGRRQMPARLQDGRTSAAGGRGIVGQFPVLPAVIVCPVCQRPNHVSPPSPNLI